MPEDSYLEIKYNGPEMVLGEGEKLDVITKRKELGLISRVEAIMEDRGVDKNSALEIMKEIDTEDLEQTKLETTIDPVPDNEMNDANLMDDEVEIDAEA